MIRKLNNNRNHNGKHNNKVNNNNKISFNLQCQILHKYKIIILIKTK